MFQNAKNGKIFFVSKRSLYELMVSIERKRHGLGRGWGWVGVFLHYIRMVGVMNYFNPNPRASFLEKPRQHQEDGLNSYNFCYRYFGENDTQGFPPGSDLEENCYPNPF